ncbi:transmembrane protein 134 isoform X5 [Neophocaena asiaeorientalis asiaeorientalis]|uniref:Transmembrane protein 134 isoform X5 n=1 Tax=Neophocaena asiaeorientalis asiaeorientalis TaxID=1706337 RepID=A0A341BUD2_NEOAA|nr:transmembrane protein 134 isoform X5 [Neophocaena asiaeorientalis asiaeorientalis]
MTPSSCPWRTRALGLSPAGSPASGRCTSSAGPGSRWPTRTSSPGCATRTWRTMRMEPRPLRSRMGEPAPGTPSSSLCTIPQDAITTPIPKGPLAHLPLSPRRAHSSCRDSGRTSVRSSQWSFSTISSSTQRSYNACCSWTQHPLIQKNHRVVLASFLLLLLGLVLILTGVGLEVAPSPGVSSAIFFVPGFLLLVPGVYHVTFIYCAVKGHRGFQFFYLPYFEK